LDPDSRSRHTHALKVDPGARTAAASPWEQNPTPTHSLMYGMPIPVQARMAMIAMLTVVNYTGGGPQIEAAQPASCDANVAGDVDEVELLDISFIGAHFGTTGCALPTPPP